MQSIFFKSDFNFKLLLIDATGREIDWPDHDWRARFWTERRASYFEASCIGGECVNCYNDDGTIHIVANSHALGPGVLQCEFTALLPDDRYPDGTQAVDHVAPLDIELTLHKAPCPAGLTATLELPAYIRDFDRLEETYGMSLDEINRRLRIILGREPSDPEQPATAATKGPAALVPRVINRGYLKNTSEPGRVYRRTDYIGVVFRADPDGNGVAVVPQWLAGIIGAGATLCSRPDVGSVTPRTFECTCSEGKAFIPGLFVDQAGQITRYDKTTLFLMKDSGRAEYVEISPALDAVKDVPDATVLVERKAPAPRLVLPSLRVKTVADMIEAFGGEVEITSEVGGAERKVESGMHFEIQRRHKYGSGSSKTPRRKMWSLFYKSRRVRADHDNRTRKTRKTRKTKNTNLDRLLYPGVYRLRSVTLSGLKSDWVYVSCGGYKKAVSVALIKA